MEAHSSVSRATKLQAGRPLSSGVLQLKLIANLKAVAQLSICDTVLPLLHMALWHYTKCSKRRRYFVPLRISFSSTNSQSFVP